MAEIAKPVTRLVGRVLAVAEIDSDLEILVGQDAGRARFVDGFGFPTDQQVQRGAAVHRHETDAGAFRDNGPRAQVIGVSHRAEDAAPIGVLAVQRGFHQRRARHRGGDALGRDVGRAVDDAHAHEFGGAFAVTDDEL